MTPIPLRLLPNTGHQHFFFPFTLVGLAAKGKGGTAFEHEENKLRERCDRDLLDYVNFGENEADKLPNLGGLGMLRPEQLSGAPRWIAETYPRDWTEHPNAKYLRYRVGCKRVRLEDRWSCAVYGLSIVVDTTTGGGDRDVQVGTKTYETATPPDPQSSAAYSADFYCGPDEQTLLARRDAQGHDPVLTLTTSSDELNGVLGDRLKYQLIWQSPGNAAEPTMTFLPVDLIVDFGNTRLAVFGLEERGTAAGLGSFMNYCRPMPLRYSRDFDTALPGEEEPIFSDSWIVLHQASFASFDAAPPLKRSALALKDDDKYGAPPQRAAWWPFGNRNQTPIYKVIEKAFRPATFVELSPVVLGGSASELLSEINEEIGGRFVLGSPKRYIWDDEPLTTETGWTMLYNPWSGYNVASGLPRLKGAFQKFLYFDDRDWPIDKPPFESDRIEQSEVGDRASFPRGAMMTLAALTLIESAYRQINSFSWRSAYQPSLRRQLRSIQFTYPSGWTQDEVERLQSKWQNAVNAFVLSRSGRKREPAPKVQKAVDEAVASQLPFVVAQCDMLNGSGLRWIKLFGRLRDATASGTSVRILSIDIGGGTTDTAIVEYRSNTEASQGVKLRASIIFRDSSSVAGDGLVWRLISRLLLPRLAERLSPLQRENFAGIWGAAGRESDRDRARRVMITRRLFLPIVYKWLNDLSVGDAVGAYSPFDVGCEPCFIDLYNKLVVVVGEAAAIDGSNKIGCDSEAAKRIIAETFSPLAREYRQLVGAYDCDFIVLAGKPSELRPVIELLRAELPLEANRVVPAKGFPVGGWFPQKHRNYMISDAKLLTVVGAALWREIGRSGEGAYEGIAGYQVEARVDYKQRYIWTELHGGVVLKDEVKAQVRAGGEPGECILDIEMRPRDESEPLQLDLRSSVIARKFLLSGGAAEPVYRFRKGAEPNDTYDEATVRFLRREDHDTGAEWLDFEVLDPLGGEKFVKKDLYTLPVDDDRQWLDTCRFTFDAIAPVAGL